MKKLFFVIFMSGCSLLSAQEKKLPEGLNTAITQRYAWPINNGFVDTTVFTKVTRKKSDPVTVYIGTEKFTGVPFFDVDEVEALDVQRGSEGGSILLTMKKGIHLQFLSINDIQKKYAIPSNASTIWMLNNEFVTEPDHFKIDSSYLYKIKLEEVPTAIADANTTVVRMFTRSKENINEFTKLRIR